jgi:hypothetical protein
MSMMVACPGCTKQLAVSPELVGQVLACPHCQSQFQVAAPAAAPAVSSAPALVSGASSGAAPRWRGDTTVITAGFKLNDTAPAAPARAALPKFKPADPSTAVVSLAQDGKLPEFSLTAAENRGSGAPPAQPQSRPVLLTLVLAVSLVLSVCLSLFDLSPGESDAEARRQARFRIVTFYKESEAALAPYQLLLRDAQRAHSRGDHAIERAKYRDVLRMLRAEHRPASLTESHDGDRELEAAIALALHED